MNRLLILFAGSTIFLTACGAGGNYIPADRLSAAVQTFKLIAPSDSVTVGSKLLVSPLIVQLDGTVPANPQIQWKVSDENIAKIESDGTLTGLAEGEVTVTGIYGGKEVAIKVAVKPATGSTGNNTGGTGIVSNPVELSKIKRIVVKLASETVPVIDYRIEKLDETLTFEATAYDEENNQLNEIVFTWSSSDQSVAAVNSTGKVTALATGHSNIIAVAGDKTSNIVRVIVPSGTVNVNVNFQGD